MKSHLKTLIFFLFNIYCCNAGAQELDANSTVSYINEEISLLARDNYPYGSGYISCELKVSSDGIINLFTTYYDSKKSFSSRYNSKFHYTEVIFGKDPRGKNKLEFVCKRDRESFGFKENTESNITYIDPKTRQQEKKPPNCIVNKSYSNEKVEIQVTSLYNLEKIINAFKYLFYLMEKDGNYVRNDKYDPFAPNNFEKTEIEIIGSKASDNIPVRSSNGVNYVNLRFGAVQGQFIIDSGASSTFINKKFEQELIKNRQITRADYITPALYQIADGSIISSRRFIAKNVKIGNFTLTDVVIGIGETNAPLLLGNTLLDKFTTWSIDNTNNILSLER
jgi:hypothetical protein